MRTVEGYQLKIQDISHLTQGECDHLVAKMGIFAVSLDRKFDNPILLEENSITAHYTREDYARDTLLHVQQYLHKIKLEGKVKATLVDMKLSLNWDEVTWSE